MSNKDFQESHAYEQLGRLIVIHNMMEAGLAMLIVDIAGLSNAGIAVNLINTLEYRRKCELLRAFATVFEERKAQLVKIADLAEKVGSKRNAAAHAVIGFQEGVGAVFMPMGGARSIRQDAKNKLFTVAEIAEVAGQAGTLHQLILEEMKVFKVSHAVAETVRQNVKDPALQAKILEKFDEVMANRADNTDVESDPN